VASIQGDPIVEKKIAGSWEWKNSGFSVDNSIIIEADKEGMLVYWNTFTTPPTILVYFFVMSIVYWALNPASASLLCELELATEKIPRQKQWFLINKSQYIARAAALLDCDQKEIDQLFPDKPQLPLDVQARLRSKRAIPQLIATFENEKEFKSKMSAIHGLIFSADSTAIRYVIKNFNKPVADTLDNWCVENTLQYEILTNLAFYHPDEPLFNKGIGDAIKYSFLFPNPDSVKVYYQKLYQWMDINYGVQSVDTQPFPFLRRYCRKK
jgi:hypothetical protein